MTERYHTALDDLRSRIEDLEAPAAPLSFGRWLLLQAEQPGPVGQLASAARGDRRFPKDGDPEAVRKHLSALGADPEVHEALNDAELDWSSY